MRYVLGLLAALAVVASFLSSEGRERDVLLVFAAASLRDVCQELESDYAERTGASVAWNFGGSNELARQILFADRADVFLSADEVQMDRVAEAGLVIDGTRRNLLTNALVVIAPTGDGDPAPGFAPGRLADPSVNRLALADPRAVPAGRYAREWLEREGLWEALSERVVPSVNVRAALAVVAAGAAPFGVVYRTDAAHSDDVHVVYEVPDERAPRIRYPVAVMKESAAPDRARAFLAYLAGDAAREIFERHGFEVIVGESDR